MTECHNNLTCEKSGYLVIVGTGIKAVSHFSLETIGHIKSADSVFYHANSGVTATYIRELNPSAIDLYEYYGEGKERNVTYVQMAELMLREVRRGRYVVGILHGHPGFFVKAGRRALAIADLEGHATRLLPGISAIDCLIADLRIDPGYVGLQILKASHILRKNGTPATNNHLALIQVGSVGDPTFSFTGFKRTKFDEFFGKLISIYGEEQDSVYYVAPIFPEVPPVIVVRKLAEYRERQALDTVNASTLYLPPKGVAFASLTTRQAFDDDRPYGQFERDAIAEIDTYKTPPEFRHRGASSAMLRAMVELGTTPKAALAFNRAPDDFFAHHATLTPDEREALLCRDTGRLRSVTTFTLPRDSTAPSGETTRPSLDELNKNILVLENIISPGDCQRLVDVYNHGLAMRAFEPGGADCQDTPLRKVLNGKFVLPSEELDPVDLRAILETVGRRLEDHFGLPRLYPDYTAYTTVLEGGSHILHADAVKLDGTPNHTPDRVATVMLYLNDGTKDFAGGLLVFPKLHREIVPRAGRLVGFMCGLEHMHEVTKVEWGVRHSIAIWFTLDKDKREI